MESSFLHILRRLVTLESLVPGILKNRDRRGMEKLYSLEKILSDKLNKVTIDFNTLSIELRERISIAKEQLSRKHEFNKMLIDEYGDLCRVFFNPVDKMKNYNKYGRQVVEAKFCRISV